MAALAFTAYEAHWFALGLGRTFGGDPRPNAMMATPFMVLSALGAVIFFGPHDNPVAALLCGLFAVYVCEFFASLGPPRPTAERALGLVHIAVGAWLMHLTVAAALGLTRGFNLPL